MNKDQFKGRWKELRGSIKKKWGELTDDELDQTEGDADRLAGLIQRKYGESREAVERELESISSR